MSAAATLASALRVLLQLRRDPRTIALLVLVPVGLLLVLDQIFVNDDPVFERVGVPMLGLFPLIGMFLVTSITMLRERSSGTLEQFLPAFVLPQLLLCGLFVPREEMASWLRLVSDVLPVTYAFDALSRAATAEALGARLWRISPSPWGRPCSRSSSARRPCGGERPRRSLRPRSA